MAADTNATSIHENRELVRLSNTEKLPIGGEKKYDAGKIDPKKSRLNIISSKATFQNPFLSLPSESEINPQTSRFNARAWMKNLVGFMSQDPNRHPRRTASVCFRNLNAYGFGTPTEYQKTVGNVLLEIGSFFRSIVQSGKQRIQILNGFDGLVDSGDMLLVLGRPGSGCSTLLKTISGDTDGFFVAPESNINFQGIPAHQMHEQFRGEAIYMAETDTHFPQLTVGQTLLFAAKARAPRDDTFPGVTKKMYAEHMRDVVLATFGLRHTIDTNVGSDLVKGVSGGERKRVSIAEAILSGSPLQCWDNSTRGLDSANALEFCRTLKLSTELAGATACVALYQASQSIYNVFDKVTVLYEGHQIYFGRCSEAKAFFTGLGFESAPRQTTADFLTSLTSPAERIVKPGFEGKTPCTAAEFVSAWKRSPEYAALVRDIEVYEETYPIGGPSVVEFTLSRRAQQAPQQRAQSPYTLSIYQQVMLCVGRGFQRLKGDASVTISRVVGNTILALVVGSVFYNLDDSTASFYSRGVLLFFAILLNAFASALEILLLYAQRPIVEKHARYALYHPFAEAISSMICDLPYKVVNCISFNLVLYFMTNLRRTTSAFFTFMVISFVTTLALSMLFRTFGAMSRTLAQALCPSAIIILALMIYTGFVIPPTEMVPWFRWINYIDPIAYAFESLMINEFYGRDFDCANFVPTGTSYGDVSGVYHTCSVVGSIPGSPAVSGTDYLKLSFKYESEHLWRNFGIILAFTLFFMFTYLYSTEKIAAKKSKGEVLLFRREHLAKSKHYDVEALSSSKLSSPVEGISAELPKKISASIRDSPSSKISRLAEDIRAELPQKVYRAIQRQTAVFQWKNICFDIKMKKETRRILDHVDGWVKPGTLTALVGPSGAGKTSLLDVLATRNTIGVVSGDVLIDGHCRDISFQRKTGYAQQQDIHLETTTVREALRFSALMRQPADITREEKLAYVEDVIDLLDMEAYADAIVGVPGEGLALNVIGVMNTINVIAGLNIEQRKKLTIGVELASRPQLLLFLDEPSSGLDSQTSWSILDLLEKLTAHGQAILCTIHQPSATLLERFDRMLFLGPNGKPVYFGELGPGCTTLTQYFEKNGAISCSPEGNPAEYIMEITGCAPGAESDIDWPNVWRSSPEFAKVHQELEHMERTLQKAKSYVSSNDSDNQEFAAPFLVQLVECFKRVNSQYWRSPTYIYSKTALCLLSALFLGFSFYHANNTLQGLQNQAFSVFMLLTMSSNLVPQILPNFLTQRAIYEARERPARTYSWQVFMLSNILVELPWNTLMAVLVFICWYYPVGLYRNAQPTHDVAERGGAMFLLVWVYMMWTSTFASMSVAAVELAEMAGNYANLLFVFSLIFCGILASPSALPGFWIFMYRLSPYTYLVSAILSIGIANTAVKCSTLELLHFEPLPNTTCDIYLAPYIEQLGGYLNNPNATTECEFCVIADTNTFLSSVGIDYRDRWRNFGILWGFVVFNILMAVLLYWGFRVPKKRQLALAETELVRAKAKQG